MRQAAPAKINLCLDLGPLRADGYHEIETVLQAVSISDTLLFHPSGSLRVQNPLVPPEVDLVLRAARLFEQRALRRADVLIEVHKRIPMGGGLGGGSSDAATTLRVLRDYLAPELPMQELSDIGAELGSDVPFFLGRSPIASAGGRGERITALHPRQELFAVIAWPKSALTTAEVYRQSVPGPGGATEAVLSGAEVGRNDLMAAALALSPECAELVSSAKALGVPLQVTGSGSAAFALYASTHDARRARDLLRGRAHYAVLCRTLGRWPWQGNQSALDE